MEKGDEKEFVALAKEIIQKCNLNVRVKNLSDCNDEFFVLLYKGLIGDNLKGLMSNPVSENDHTHNCKCVIDSLASDVLNVDLSHINAKGIVSGDVISIKNLLEIFSGLLEYFMECIDENQSDFEDDLDDSNVITADHDVISSLLREEFGSSYTDHSRKDTNLLGKRVRPNDSRMTTDPSIRISSFTGSGHEADFSEQSQVSDSTNELIKLGESSSSGSSSVVKKGSLRELGQKKSAKITWQHSTLSDNHQELTQYTISSDEGDSLNAQDNKNQSSDHLSSSLMSSTSSWRQQISPLDADDHGIKLDTIGLRPNADKLTTASGNVPSSHYSKIQDYRDIPGNIKTSAQVNSTMLPGISSIGREPLPENLPGQLLPRQSLPETSVHTSGRTGISRVTGLSKLAVSESNIGHGISQSIPRQSSLFKSQNVLPKDTSSSLAGLSQRIPVSDYSASSIPEVQFSSSVSATKLPVSAYTRTGQTSYSSTGISSSTSSRVLTGLTGQRQTMPSSSAFQTTATDQQSTTTRTGLSGKAPIPGVSDQFQLRKSVQEQRAVSSADTTATKTTVPGQDYTFHKGLSDYHSRLRPHLHTEKPITGISTRVSSTVNTSHVPALSDSVRLRDPSIVPGQRSLLDQYSLSKGTSITTATSLPSSSGLLTVSSGGYSDVFTSTTNTNMYKQYVLTTSSKSLDTRKSRESKELNKTLESEVVPTTSKDNRTSVLSQPGSSRQDVQPGSSHQDIQPLDSESDDDDAARYSDSAIDYNRGDDQADSDNDSSEDSILRRIHDRWKRLKTSQSTKPSAQRAVTFNDDIETIPITSRMDRLRRLLDDEADEQRQQTAALRNVYAEQLQDIQKQQQQDRNEMKKRKVQKSPLVPKKKAKKTVPSKQRGRLEAIYRPQGRPGRPTKRRSMKSRKRSASASPDIGRRRRSTLADFHETLLPSLFEEFPFLHVSPQTTHSMWQKQAKQISLLSKSETAALKTKGQRRVEEAEKRQEQLLKILRKELEHNERMRSERERQDHQRTIKAKVNEKRQVAARARRYYDEYQLRMRAKMLKRRTREEQILKKLFDDGLEIQKQRVRELRKYAKEKSEVIEQRQSNEIESLENYYKDQFSMLAEDMTRERKEMKVRQQAQEKVMRQMRRELRKKMEKEIEDLQETLTRDEDSAYFRQLEADRLRREFQLAMYKSDL